MVENNLQHYEQFNGLIFDMDGTLLSTEKVHYQAWEVMLDKYQFDFKIEDLAQYNGIPSWRLMGMLIEKQGTKLDPHALAKEKLLICESVLFEQTEILPAVEVVKHFAGKKLMAVGTGSSHLLAERLLKHFDLFDYFSLIIGEDDVKEHKPAPETFLRCAQGIGIQPSRCVVFEDGDLGIQAAKSANMAVVDVRNWHLFA